VPASAHNFGWLGQAQQTEKQIETSQSTGSQLADTQRYVGHCYLQAAYQATSNMEFKNRMRRAGDAFTQAALAAKKLPNEQATILEPGFRALAIYCEAQLANDDSSALNYLHRALGAFTNPSLTADKLAVVSPIFPLEYICFTNDLMNYEPELSLRLPALRTALSFANSLENFLPNLNDDLQAVFLNEVVQLQLNAGINLPEYEQREGAGLKALELFEQLRRVVQRSADPRSAVAAFALQIFWAQAYGYGVPDQPPIINAIELLGRTEESDDRFAIGVLLTAILRNRMYAISGVEDPAEAKRSLSQGRLEADRASAELEAFTGVRRFWYSSGYVNWTFADLLISYSRLFAESLDERRKLVNEAVTISRRIRELGPPLGVWPQHSNLSFYIFEQARLQRSLDQKQRLLDEAYEMGLRYEKGSKQFAPYWLQGHAEHFIAYGQIKRERAKLDVTGREGILKESVEMFQKAADALESVVNSALVTEPATKQRLLARMQFDLGSTQLELYRVNRNTKLLDVALTNLSKSAEAQRAQQISVRAAEALTRIAEAYVLGGRFEHAESAFSEASKRYLDASKRYPALAPAFNAQASLMQARAATASARAAYLRNDYEVAAGHYREASRVLEEAKSFPALIAIYDAWALLSEAEEHTWKTPVKVEAVLQTAIGKFDVADNAFESPDQATEDQRTLITQGRRLAEALLQLDRARSLERGGKLFEAVNRLGEAARLFHTLADETDDTEAKASILAHAQLTQACQQMLQAEQLMNPDSYNQAALLFQEAQRSSKSKQLALTAGGWAASCKALEAGLRYRQSADKTQFEALKKHLASAQGYFVDAGAVTTAAWVTGTERMFDAIAYLGEAESRLDPKERVSLQEQAEKSLQIAAQMFERSGHAARQEDTIRHLHSMIEQRQLGISRPTLSAPVIQSVSGLATQTLTQELLIGSEVASAPPLQAALKGPEKPLRIGEEYQLPLTVLNTGERLAILVRIENLSYPGLDIQSGTPDFSLVNGNLELGGKRLPSLAAQEVPLRVTPRRAGSYRLKPRILSVSTQGDLTIHSVPTLALDVAGERTPRAEKAQSDAIGRFSLGVPRVDKPMRGGIPVGHAVVITAAPSNETRAMVRSFILSGLSSGKHVLYITRDPTLLSNVPGSELEKLSLISIGDVLEGPVHAIAAKVANLTEILLETTELIQSAEGSDKRACIDILSDILLQHGALNSRKWVSDIIRKLKANGYTTLAVLDPKLHEPKESQALLSLFDGEIEISEREVEGTTRQLLRVRRMYDTQYDPEWVQFS
jgi:KaiC/GvpD/RAD55 family RecA-like ATPase